VSFTNHDLLFISLKMHYENVSERANFRRSGRHKTGASLKITINTQYNNTKHKNNE
jgi:hypothetical protein